MKRFYITMAQELEGKSYDCPLVIKTSSGKGAILAFGSFDLAQFYLNASKTKEVLKITDVLPAFNSDTKSPSKFLVFEDTETYNDFMVNPRSFDYDKHIKEETI
jgi:hypothetical protein